MYNTRNAVDKYSYCSTRHRFDPLTDLLPSYNYCCSIYLCKQRPRRAQKYGLLYLQDLCLHVSPIPSMIYTW